ncbi:hypothetical protein [Actinoplanes sp. NPDC051851]|uniref:hypothetical protein n=1 Tax=Actinoplanes sp. NPDC051851 TaxID=3154753 RepID=UPI0034370B9E
MHRRIPGWINWLVVGLAVVVSGLWLVVQHTRTAAEVRSETVRDVAGYVPRCGWSAMAPGDTCADDHLSYQQLRDRYAELHTVDRVARSHGRWRTGGMVVMGLGGVLILLVGADVARTALRRRRLAAETADVIVGEPRRPVAVPESVLLPPLIPAGGVPDNLGLGGAIVPMAVTTGLLAGGISWLVAVAGLNGATMVALPATLIAAWWFLAARSVLLRAWRSRRVRPRWAAAHGYEFRPFDSDLLDRLALPDTVDGIERAEPYGERVVYGTVDGLPFVLFDYRNGRNVNATAWAMALPGAVPRIAVGPQGGAREPLRGSSRSWHRVWPFLRKVADLHHPDAFHADGALIWEEANRPAGPHRADLDARLAGLRRMGRLLAQAHVPREL